MLRAGKQVFCSSDCLIVLSSSNKTNTPLCIFTALPYLSFLIALFSDSLFLDLLHCLSAVLWYDKIVFIFCDLHLVLVRKFAK